MSSSGGHILVEQAYAQGKMLDHSSWQGILPRSITPSDGDAILDNNGLIMFWELSSHHAEWKSLDKGQRRLYENMVRGSNGLAIAVLLCHDTPQHSAIDTRAGIESFQVLFSQQSLVQKPTWRYETILRHSKVIKGSEYWQRFILGWYSNPVKLLSSLFGAKDEKVICDPMCWGDKCRGDCTCNCACDKCRCS